MYSNEVMLVTLTSPSPRLEERKKGISDRLLDRIGPRTDLGRNKWLQEASECPQPLRRAAAE